jgi:hypothetical protein
MPGYLIDQAFLLRRAGSVIYPRHPRCGSLLAEFQPRPRIRFFEDHNNGHFGLTGWASVLEFQKQRTRFDRDEFARPLTTGVAAPRFYRFVVLIKRHM